MNDACALLDISRRTLQRWGTEGLGDRRKGAVKRIPRQLSEEERETLYRTATEQRFQDMTPAEIVPTLLDEGIYLASERTLYRLLKARAALAPRQESPSTRQSPSSACLGGYGAKPGLDVGHHMVAYRCERTVQVRLCHRRPL